MYFFTIWFSPKHLYFVIIFVFVLSNYCVRKYSFFVFFFLDLKECRFLSFDKLQSFHKRKKSFYFQVAIDDLLTPCCSLVFLKMTFFLQYDCQTISKSRFLIKKTWRMKHLFEFVLNLYIITIFDRFYYYRKEN